METAYSIIEHHLPVYTWPLLFLIFFLLFGLCLWLGKKGSLQTGERVVRAVLQSIFITYSTTIFFTTLIFRKTAATPKAEWMPFWSWHRVIINHSRGLLLENVLNLLLFMPVGVCLALLYKIKPKTAFLVGLLWSAAIETIQFITCRGLFEWDDMLHNGLGCMIGATVGGAALQLWKSRRKK